ncbi:CCA tRNA nucleotidyltransferase [Paenibacillus lemnae]|uniref:CCA tRNA nucleotidyltransferase n=1 Tax=Paenibacillus lemnae TaxID=1330551 RepID=A0A848MBY5_PAELE|nr:CCA tRNA nucleotidyltransferase [Paenibacillus lemnae]NMO98016.1 CCA tRNA nucleotidyltransferase [Paenibacillus lemnae]
MAEHRESINWKHADPLLVSGSVQVIKTILENGYEAFWVGGCVRDEYMGRNVSDIDITTSALPDVITSLFDRVIPTGIQHGTVTVLAEGQSYEVTTYRVERGSDDHRHPAEIVFVNEIEKDLRRRDFTMNAMALGLEGQWVDPFGGRDDIDKALIRCVGEAKVRFQEDALRMVRCIRFASVFGFMIAKDTWNGLLEVKKTLGWIAMERIRSELDKMMSGPDPLRGLSLIKESGLHLEMKVPFPYQDQEQDVSFIRAIQGVSADQPDIRWALLLMGCKISAAESSDLLRKWTFSNRRRELILGLVKFQEAWDYSLREAQPDADRVLWIQLVLQMGVPAAEAWLQLQEGIRSTGGTALVQIEDARVWLKGMQVKSLKELALTGDELLTSVNRRGGPWMKGLLSHLLFQTAAGYMQNDETVLIEEAKRVIQDEGI